jgi:tetratricopeptide (TPR) repeat protein
VAQEQRRLEEAEQLYRQALDLKLEFNDRHSAASTYHALGMVAQEQRRLEEAEQHYRNAVKTYQDQSDQRAASQSATALGRLLAEQGRNNDAIEVLADAAASWRLITGNFDPTDLQLLRTLKERVDPQTFHRKLDTLDQSIADELQKQLDQPQQN